MLSLKMTGHFLYYAKGKYNQDSKDISVPVHTRVPRTTHRP